MRDAVQAAKLMAPAAPCVRCRGAHRVDTWRHACCDVVGWLAAAGTGLSSKAMSSHCYATCTGAIRTERCAAIRPGTHARAALQVLAGLSRRVLDLPGWRSAPPNTTLPRCSLSCRSLSRSPRGRLFSRNGGEPTLSCIGCVRGFGTKSCVRCGCRGVTAVPWGEQAGGAYRVSVRRDRIFEMGMDTLNRLGPQLKRRVLHFACPSCDGRLTWRVADSSGVC